MRRQRLMLLEHLLAALVRKRDREALLGDLREVAGKTPERAARLYWREVLAALGGLPRRLVRDLVIPSKFGEESMPFNGNATRRPVAFVFALGTLGGAALIATTVLSHRGPLIFLPYAAIVVAGFAYLRGERVRPFTRRFLLSLGSFMVATVVLYLFIGFFAAQTALRISAFGHAWRLGLMLLIGSVLSGAVAQLTATRERGGDGAWHTG